MSRVLVHEIEDFLTRCVTLEQLPNGSQPIRNM